MREGRGHVAIGNRLVPWVLDENEAFHLETMNRYVYPVSLEALRQEGFVDDLPADPFGGGAIVYKSDADGFIVYSVGPDGIDDGGIRGDVAFKVRWTVELPAVRTVTHPVREIRSAAD